MDLRDELISVLDNTVIEEMFEPSVDVALSTACAKIIGAPVYIWSENELPIFVRLFKGLGLNVRKIVCLSQKKFNAIDNIPIIMPKELINENEPNKFFFVNSTDYDQNFVDKIYDSLQSIDTAGVFVFNEYDWIKMVGHTKTFWDLNRILSVT